MSVALPNWPGPVSITPSMIRAGNDLRPPLGGPVQRINRMGDRFSFAVVMPPMDRADSDKWVALLLDGYDSTVTLEWAQPDGGVGNPGAPVVNGYSQAGRLLNLRGFNAGYTVRTGQFMTIFAQGKHFALMPTADRTASAGGLISLPFLPMLRLSPPDGAPVEVSQPIIEGQLGGDVEGWTIDVAQETGLTFTITER